MAQKVGPKEKANAALRGRKLSRAHELMLEDGVPEACLRFPDDKPKTAIKPKPANGGVTLAPPLAVQKAIAADLADEGATPKTPAPPAVDRQETDDMNRKTKKTATKKSAKGKSRTAVKGKTSARADGLREGSKQAQMLDLALDPAGVTEAAICKKLGWEKCSATLGRVCDKVGASLVRKDGKFFATMKGRRSA